MEHEPDEDTSTEEIRQLVDAIKRQAWERLEWRARAGGSFVRPIEEIYAAFCAEIDGMVNRFEEMQDGNGRAIDKTLEMLGELYKSSRGTP